MQSFVLLIHRVAIFPAWYRIGKQIRQNACASFQMSKQQSIRAEWNTRFFIYEHRCSCMKVDNNGNCLQRSLFSSHSLSSIFHFYSFLSLFSFLEGESNIVSKQLVPSFNDEIENRLSISYNDDISIVIFSKKELLIKRKKKKDKKGILKNLIIGKLRLLEIIIIDGKVYLFIYCK